MKLAFLVLTHTLPQQTIRLLNALYHPEHLFLIHVDKKAGHQVHSPLYAWVQTHPNAFALSRRRTWWGGISFVETLLTAIDFLQVHRDWDYLINLSGQDFPLVPTEHVAHQLQQTAGLNWMECRPIHDIWSNPETRLNRYHIQIPGTNYIKRIPLLNRHVCPPSPLYGGSSYLMLHRSFCDHVSREADIQTYLRYFQYTFIPEEMFFQTLIMASPFSLQVRNDSKRYVDWNRGPQFPRILLEEDWPRLQRSSAFWARKFDCRIDNEILSILETQLKTLSKET
jgi:hypothetical protein